MFKILCGHPQFNVNVNVNVIHLYSFKFKFKHEFSPEELVSPPSNVFKMTGLWAI